MGLKEQFSRNNEPQFKDWNHDDYEDTAAYYSDEKDTSPREWPVENAQFVSSGNEDTVPMNIEREDLEAVERALNLEDALQAYDRSYSLEEIDAGEKSPQLCAEMLLRINKKFENDMTPEEHKAVALETIAVGHRIGSLAEKPVGEAVDRTSLKGLTAMAEVMDCAQAYAPEEIPALEKEMLDVADKIDSRISQPISGPIRLAIKQFNNLSEDEKHEIPFTEIFVQVSKDNLNHADDEFMKKLDADKKLFAQISGSSPTPAQDIEKTPDATGLHVADSTDTKVARRGTKHHKSSKESDKTKAVIAA